MLPYCRPDTLDRFGLIVLRVLLSAPPAALDREVARLTDEVQALSPEQCAIVEASGDRASLEMFSCLRGGGSPTPGVRPATVLRHYAAELCGAALMSADLGRVSVFVDLLVDDHAAALHSAAQHGLIPERAVRTAYETLIERGTGAQRELGVRFFRQELGGRWDYLHRTLLAVARDSARGEQLSGAIAERRSAGMPFKEAVVVSLAEICPHLESLSGERRLRALGRVLVAAAFETPDLLPDLLRALPDRCAPIPWKRNDRERAATDPPIPHRLERFAAGLAFAGRAARSGPSSAVPARMFARAVVSLVQGLRGGLGARMLQYPTAYPLSGIERDEEVVTHVVLSGGALRLAAEGSLALESVPRYLLGDEKAVPQLLTGLTGDFASCADLARSVDRWRAHVEAEKTPDYDRLGRAQSAHGRLLTELSKACGRPLGRRDAEVLAGVLLDLSSRVSAQFFRERVDTLLKGAEMLASERQPEKTWSLNPTERSGVHDLLTGAVADLSADSTGDEAQLLLRALLQDRTLTEIIFTPTEMTGRLRDIVVRYRGGPLQQAPSERAQLRREMLRRGAVQGLDLSAVRVLSAECAEGAAAVAARYLVERHTPEWFVATVAAFLPGSLSARDLSGALSLALRRDQAFSKITGLRLSDIVSDRELALTDLLRTAVPGGALRSAGRLARGIVALRQDMNDLVPALRMFARLRAGIDDLADPQTECLIFRDYLRTHGMIELPREYREFRRAKIDNAVQTRDETQRGSLLDRRSEIFDALLRDAVDGMASARDQDLIEQICHSTRCNFGIPAEAMAAVQRYAAVRRDREAAVKSVREGECPKGGAKSAWDDQRVFLDKSARLRQAFEAVGRREYALALNDAPEPLAPGDNPRLKWLFAVTPEIWRTVSQNMPDREALRELLRALMLNDPHEPGEDPGFDCGILLLTLQLLSGPPQEGRKAAFRFNGHLDQEGQLLLLAELGDRLRDETFAHDFLFFDSGLPTDVRSTVVTRLLRFTAYDELSEALRLHSLRTALLRPSAKDGRICTVSMIPQFGLLRDLSGFVSDTCYADDPEAFKGGTKNLPDDGRPNICYVAFVRDFGTANAELVGGSLVLGSEYGARPGGKPRKDLPPALVIRACNPRQEFLRRIYAGEILEHLISYLGAVAERVGPDCIVTLPRDIAPFVALTNRSSIYYSAQRRYFHGRLMPTSNGKTEFNGQRVGERTVLVYPAE